MNVNKEILKILILCIFLHIINIYSIEVERRGYMNGKGAYAVPVDMPLVAKKPLKRTMPKKAKEYFDFMNSRNIELFEDENTGELFSKVTDLNTGKTEIRKCTFTDED